VVHESAAVADAWDTALAVLEPDVGYELAEREGLAALFLMRVGDGFEARATPALAGRITRLGDR
jgi:thiamine biosynthesis lipoprotein